MMCAAGIYPRSRTGSKIRFQLPHKPCDREVGHGSGLFYKRDLGAYQTESVAKVYHRHCNAITVNSVKYKSCRVGFSADAERMHLYLRFVRRKHGRYLQHMCRKLKLLA